MKIIEKEIELKESVKVFDIIQEILLENRSTQVFVDDEIYHELAKNGSKYSVYYSNSSKTDHYKVDDDNFGGESWLMHTIKYAYDDIIHDASFISNCLGYMQLVQFLSKDIKKYTHFYEGFEQLLIIKVKK